MNWAPFVVVTWLLFGAEMGLKDALQLGAVGVAPSFVVALLVFVAMSAPMGVALACGLIIGVLLDLTNAVPTTGGGGSLTVIGPYAVGATAAAYAVVVTRGLVMRHNPLTFAFLAFLASIILHVAAVTIFSMRSWFDPVEFHAGRELLLRLGSSAYTGALALLLGPGLRLLTPVFGFPASQRARQRATAVRAR